MACWLLLLRAHRWLAGSGSVRTLGLLSHSHSHSTPVLLVCQAKRVAFLSRLKAGSYLPPFLCGRHAGERVRACTGRGTHVPATRAQKILARFSRGAGLYERTTLRVLTSWIPRSRWTYPPHAGHCQSPALQRQRSWWLAARQATGSAGK